MQKSFLRFGALLAALAVILGAFGAHALKQIISLQSLAIYETGVRYQFYHAFALLVCGIIYKEFPNKFLVFAGRLFCAGILLFSGSLYWLSFIDVEHSPLKLIGAITPLGGLCFILGWLFMAYSIAKNKVSLN